MRCQAKLGIQESGLPGATETASLLYERRPASRMRKAPPMIKEEPWLALNQ